MQAAKRDWNFQAAKWD